MLAARTSSNSFDAQALAVTAAWFRPCAVLGQILAIVATVVWLGVELPLLPLAFGLVVLMGTGLLGWWRLRCTCPFSEAEVFCHVALDMLVLAWALYFTGGAANPFITLLLAPVALTAAALTWRATVAVTVLSALIYGYLMVRNVPLAGMEMHGSGHGFRLHLAGMAVNFLIAIVLLAVFVGRMSALLKRQREAALSLRERALRDEGVMAIAIHAAQAAHQLNTPLSTLRTLLSELQHDQDSETGQEVRVMVGEVERCRKILRDMVVCDRQTEIDAPGRVTVGTCMDDSIEQLRLLYPEVDITCRFAEDVDRMALKAGQGLTHALLNLLHNALDASRQNGSHRVAVSAVSGGRHVEITITDDGNGFVVDRASVMPGYSSKPDGLGIGLLLARSTIERVGGELIVGKAGVGGRVIVRLPVELDGQS